MIHFPNPIKLLAPAFERYITIHGLDGDRTYNYAARGFFNLPAVRHTRHGAKCATGESWVYVALAAGTSPTTMSDDDKLYIGSQTADRMFRGDDRGVENFHHAQMRCDGERKGLVPYLRLTDRGVEIFRASKESLLRAAGAEPSARWLKRLADVKHFGALVEDLVLHVEGPGNVWKWNSKGPHFKNVQALEQAYATYRGGE